MKSCDEWIKIDYDLIVMDFSNVLSSYIRDQCDCNSSIYQSLFQCSKHDPNDMIFRAKILLYSDTDATAVSGILQHWIASEVSVTIRGETLLIEMDECPLQILSLDDPICKPSGVTARSLPTNYVIVGSVLASLACAILIIATSTIILCIIIRKSKR